MGVKMLCTVTLSSSVIVLHNVKTKMFHDQEPKVSMDTR